MMEGLWRCDCEVTGRRMGRDFWVVSPCYRLTDPTSYLEGTRLTMVYKQPDGIEFTTRMPGLPGRYKEYAVEMEYAFNKLKIAINKGKKHIKRIANH